MLYVWKDPPERFRQQVLYKLDPGRNADVLSMTFFKPNNVALGMYDGTVVLWESDGSWRKKLKFDASGVLKSGEVCVCLCVCISVCVHIHIQTRTHARTHART